MTQFLDANLTVIRRRWPEVAERLASEPDISAEITLVQGLQVTVAQRGVQLTSRHNRIAEATKQAHSVPKGAPYAMVCGTGLGDLQQLLLRRDGLETLDVLILNPGLFNYVLANSDQLPWLADERTQLRYGDNVRLAKPLAAITSELMLADERFEDACNQLHGHLNIDYINQLHKVGDAAIEARFREHLKAKQGEVKSLFNLFDSEAHQLAGRNKRAMVVAAGPSLQYGLERIKQQRASTTLISVDTGLKALLDAGITPDYVVTIDPTINEHHLQTDRIQGVPLVHLPRLDTKVLESWNGPRYLAAGNSELYKKFARKADCGVLVNGGVVTHSALDLAVQMGAEEVELYGCDFAYVDGRTHTGYEEGELNAYHKNATFTVLGQNGERLPTEGPFARALYFMESYIANRPQVRFINTGTIGALIKGTVSLEEVA
ncbi:motility associated factor glycosyltransferase family protein [Ferrimonas marina]|uniref:6-hydroxymethylpterin diphosphokinase MptE-like domain-containing protein n=1 Tax=Ferrimonas marina TaxID=299255 RepID=A0A1M5QUN7_9GAMM|nr:6-hydroxymethylpterin diphosphokinase MptE-like protein [Ferrimonas marina]SHH17864.1 Protein of unknown function DUF115 [Ferrimonas marina]